MKLPVFFSWQLRIGPLVAGLKWDTEPDEPDDEDEPDDDDKPHAVVSVGFNTDLAEEDLR